MTETADHAFSDRTFDETLRLIEDIRDYITSGESRQEREDAHPASRMRAAREMSRLTNRATAAMSIVLLHKALVGGQADDITDVTGRLVEMQESMWLTPAADALDEVPLPPAVADLVSRAEALFGDVERILPLIRQHPDAVG